MHVYCIAFLIQCPRITTDFGLSLRYRTRLVSLRLKGYYSLPFHYPALHSGISCSACTCTALRSTLLLQVCVWGLASNWLVSIQVVACSNFFPLCFCQTEVPETSATAEAGADLICPIQLKTRPGHVHLSP